VVAATVGRLPLGIVSIATILLVHESTGSYADAGVVLAANTAALALASPVQGRLVDRHGQPALLIPAAVIEAAALTALWIAADAGAATGVLAALAAVAGMTVPPLSPCMRMLWRDLLRDSSTRLDTAYALESVLVELVFIAGPLVTALIVAFASPAATLVVAAALILGGTVVFATAAASRKWRSTPGDGAGRSALASPGIRTLVAAIVPAGAALGIVELTTVVFAREHGDPAWAGVLVALLGAGSMAGGLWYGARTWGGPVSVRFVVLAWLFAAGLLPLAIAGSIPVMAILLVIAGLALAPVTACVYVLVGEIAPAGMLTEGYTWLITANVVGSSGGAALAGLLNEHWQPSVAFVVAAAAAALSALISAARLETLAVASPAGRSA
jgi:MFS family permease